ncbi:MAG: MerR family transcriptional regulator, partial [Coprobacillus sp.]
VEISFDTEMKSGSYDYLYLFDDYIKFCDEYIKVDDIVSIDISMFSSQGNSGMYFLLLNYYIDLDISVNNQIYSFEILNNSMVKNMFNYFESHSIKFNDPLNLNKIYHEISDPVKLNKYFNSHFREWANEYNLDNPRDNYYRIMKNNFIMPLEDIKNNPKPLIRNEFKELFRVWKEKIKKPGKS